MEPDARIRDAVRALADDGPVLAPATLRRIARSVAERGPAEIERGRRTVVAKRSAAVFIAAAAAVVLGTLASRDEPPAVASREPTPAMLPSPPMCATRSVGTEARFMLESSGARRLDLGTRGLVTASEATQVSIETLTPCELVLALDGGSVSVDARDLGGGTLSIATPEARVTVRGTELDVRRIGETTEVRVREGVVEGTAGDSTLELRAGEAARATSGAIERTSASEWDGAPSAPPLVEEEVNPSARRIALDAETLARRGADRERTGDLAGARADYRAAMAMRGLTAEAACLSLARLELGAGRHEEAREALRVHRTRFTGGSLAVEAAWLAVQIERAAGRVPSARALAEQLVRDHRGSAQARAASRWLASTDSREDGR